MATQLKSIITVADYIEYWPQDASVDEDIIQSAINRAIITLDAICGGMISQVWDVTTTTDPLYRTTQEHEYIKQAHYLQAQYNVSRNLDFSAGTESYTSGSNNYNETRSRPDLVADETIYQLLAQARVYNPNITTNTNITGTDEEFYNPSYDPGENYITYNVGDNRYVFKHWSDAAGKFAYYDENGNITTKPITASETGTSTSEVNYITIGDTEYKIGGSGAPDEYLKTASVTDNTLTLTKQDDTTLTYTPSGFVELLGNEEVSGEPYKFPYYFSITPSADNIVVTDYTITLDNNKTTGTYNLTVPAATTTTAGLLTASDKTKLDGITPGAGVWGSITGTITNQTDLQDQFATKQAKVTYSATEPTSPNDNDIWVNESTGTYSSQHLYQHRIKIIYSGSSLSAQISIIYTSIDNTTITKTNIGTYYDLLNKISSFSISGNNFWTSDTVAYQIEEVEFFETYLYLKYAKNNSVLQPASLNYDAANVVISDTVTQIF